jgi:hypothetical protein
LLIKILAQKRSIALLARSPMLPEFVLALVQRPRAVVFVGSHRCRLVSQTESHANGVNNLSSVQSPVGIYCKCSIGGVVDYASSGNSS